MIGWIYKLFFAAGGQCPAGYHDDEIIAEDQASVTVRCRRCKRRTHVMYGGRCSA